MKRLFLVTFAIAYCSGTLFSQNYRLFDPGQEYFYGTQINGENSFSEAIHIDTSISSGSDWRHYNYLIVDTLGNLAAPCTHQPGQISWLGEQVLERINGVFYLFNRQGDSIRIEAQTPLNASFQLFDLGGGNSLEAEVVSISPGLFLGQNDTIKVFQVHALDAMGQPMAHPMDQKEIHIAKAGGLMQALPFRDFPDDHTELPIQGIGNPNLGRHNFGVPEMYDWEVGDTFQYESGINLFSFSNDTTWEEIVVLSKYFSPNLDTIRYEVQSRVYRHAVFYSPFNDTVMVANSVLTTQFIKGQGKWYSPDLPWQIKIENGNLAAFENPAVPEEMPILFWDLDYHGRSQKRYSGLWSYSSIDSCLSQAISTGVPLYADYAAGIGLVYFNFDDGFNHNYEVLCYYHKNGETWGNRKDFDLLLSVDENPRLTVQVYPNPVKVQLHIKGLYGAAGSFDLYDLSGKQVMEMKWEEGQGKIDLSLVQPGFYIFRLQTEDGKMKQGKLKID